MKRFTFILLSLSAALFVLPFTSCEKNEIHEDFYLNTKTINYLVRTTDWKIATDDESGKYWYCEFKEPLLTQSIINNGMVVSYLSLNGRLTPLPFSDFWVDKNGYKWEELVTCELEAGRVTFIFKPDDHIEGPYYDYDFVLKLMW